MSDLFQKIVTLGDRATRKRVALKGAADLTFKGLCRAAALIAPQVEDGRTRRLCIE